MTFDRMGEPTARVEPSGSVHYGGAVENVGFGRTVLPGASSDEKDLRMALTKDQMARRAATEFESPADSADAKDSVMLVASFVHSELESATRRTSRSNITVTGALQVSEAGDLGTSSRIGDTWLALGEAGNEGSAEPRILVVMEHCEKDGTPRIVRTCGLAFSGRKRVSRVLTELATIDVTPDGLILREVAPGVSARDVQEVTEPTLKVGPDLQEMRPA